MPVKSYIAIPVKGKKGQLQKDILDFPECEVLPADNKDVLVVLTETTDEKKDKILFNKLSELENLNLLNLVSAFL